MESHHLPQESLEEVDVLRVAVESRFRVNARLLRSVPVPVQAQAEEIVILDVYEFDLHDAGAVRRAYAWLQRVDGNAEKSPVVILETRDVQSPVDAVHTFIARRVRREA